MWRCDARSMMSRSIGLTLNFLGGGMSGTRSLLRRIGLALAPHDELMMVLQIPGTWSGCG